MKRSIAASAIAILAATLLSLFSCTPAMKRYTATDFDYFDTVTELIGYTQSEERFNEVREKTEKLLDRYHKFYDIYNTYDGTVNLATVNLTAGSGEKRSFEVSEEIYELLIYAKEIYDDCGKKVNVALGSVTSLWKSSLEKGSVPDTDAVIEAGKHTDMTGFEVTSEGSKYILTVTDPLLTFDVGALAKGFAAKKASELLQSLKSDGEGFLLNLGGMVCPIGTKPDGVPFVAGVDYPTSEPKDGYLRRIYAKDRAIVTSATHLRSYKVNGIVYSHIIDPDSLHPSNGFAAVTVVAPDAATGDALSTALFCMTEEEGRRVIENMREKYGSIDVMWVYPNMEVSTTENFPKDIKE